MADGVARHIRCQRCGAEMEMRDPGPGMPWAPDQFWVCPRCGRHFWSTYSTAAPAAPAADKAKPATDPVPLTPDGTS